MNVIKDAAHTSEDVVAGLAYRVKSQSNTVPSAQIGTIYNYFESDYRSCLVNLGSDKNNLASSSLMTSA